MSKLSYTDLLTPEGLKIDAFRSLKVDITDPTVVEGLGASYKELAIRAIQDVTSAIEGYLDRQLIVRKYDIDIPDYKWSLNKSLNKWQHYPRHWPVVQVESEGVTISNDNVRLLSNSPAKTVEMFCGYRLSSQSLEDLQGEDALVDLTNLPPILPYRIRRVVFRLVMFEMKQARQNTFGEQTSTAMTGQTQIQTTTEREEYYRSELMKLDNDKYH